MANQKNNARRLAICLLAVSAFAQNPPAWVQKSNRNAQLLIDIDTRYSPESTASQGVGGVDSQITVLTADRGERRREDLRGAEKDLETRLRTEADPLVRQDLEILVAKAKAEVHSSEANERHLLPYFNVPAAVYGGLTDLLDDQVSPERRAFALTRLRKYTGLEPGFTPMTLAAQDRFREKLKTPGLVGPSRLAVEKNLENTQAFLTGLVFYSRNTRSKAIRMPWQS